MAVYQGARLRTDALPAGGVASRQARAAALPSTNTTTNSRVRPMGLLMAVIVAVTMLGLVDLPQTLGSSATDTEIWRLQKASGELVADTRTLQIQVLKATESDEIVPEAKKLKLQRLGQPKVLTAP